MVFDACEAVCEELSNSLRLPAMCALCVHAPVVTKCSMQHSLNLGSVSLCAAQDNERPLWRYLVQLLSTHESSDSYELARLASAVLSNLLLDFSPCKQDLVEKADVLSLFGRLASSADSDLKLNGIWGLMVRSLSLGRLYVADQLCLVSECGVSGIGKPQTAHHACLSSGQTLYTPARQCAHGSRFEGSRLAAQLVD